MLELLPVPVYTGKSDKQANIDLVHPVLNALIEYWLQELGWESQCSIHDLTGGKEASRKTVDFALKLEDGRYLVIEIQFGNGGRLQADFEKFRQLQAHGLLAMSYVVYFDTETAKTADSGLATYEQALREMHRLADLPLGVVGLSRRESAEIDLRQVPGIPYPEVLGGSGKGRKELHKFLADAIVNDRTLKTLVQPQHIRDIVKKHGLEHGQKCWLAWLGFLEKTLACDIPELKHPLMAFIAQCIRSSYIPEAELKKHIRASERATAKAARQARGAGTQPLLLAQQAQESSLAERTSDGEGRTAETPSNSAHGLASASSSAPATTAPRAAPVAAAPSTPAQATGLICLPQATSARASVPAAGPTPSRARRVTAAEVAAQAQAAQRPRLFASAPVPRRAPNSAMGQAFQRAWGT